MKHIAIKTTLCTVLAFAMSSSLLRAEDDKIEEIMKKAFKGDNSLYKKVATGKGTAADNEKLVTFVKELAGTKPPKGDLEKWNQRTAALVKAAEEVVAGIPHAMANLQKSGNCKGCHRDHKEDEEDREQKGRGKKED